MPADIRTANASWEALLTAHSQLMRRFAEEQVWREHGLSMREYDVLYTLSKCPAVKLGLESDGTRMGELQGGVLLSQPALSRLVDRLESRGFVERVSDESDRRAVRVRLTPAGAEVQQAVGRSHARSVDREMRALIPDEQRELERLTRKLIGE